MATAPNVEQRLSALEREMDEVKRELASRETSKNWIERISGSFEGDADFEEVLRLGREFRQSQLPPDGEERP